MVAKDATFLISIAAEEFIMRLSEAAKRIAEREMRSTVQYKDIGSFLCNLTTFDRADVDVALQLLSYEGGTSSFSSKVRA